MTGRIMNETISSGDAARPQAKASLGGHGEGDKQDQNPSKKPGVPPTHRKRTKTGCLTCRKRRIKCDESRPTCNNCIKSKRACEGYNQRVVFKDPLGAYPYAGTFGHFGYTRGLPSHFAQLSSQQSRACGQGPLPTIAPKPPSFGYQQQPHSLQYGFPYQPSFPHTSNPTNAFDFDNGNQLHFDSFAQQSNSLVSNNPYPHGPQFMTTFQGQHVPSLHNAQHLPRNEVNLRPYTGPNPNDSQEEKPVCSGSLVTVNLAGDFEEISDEEASMPDSDDGELPSKRLMAPVVRNMHSFGPRHATVRSFAPFTGNDIVVEYMSSPYATELKDEAKMRLFEHFKRVTGPSISLYERRLCDSPERITDGIVPDGNSNIWSYTFPIMAIRHPALLHAMLAMASLQISKAQKIPSTAAHKHYHLALRRVARNVQSDTKRLQTATLAATLLLAYFEVYDSDHTKWCSHLYGARTLLAEIPMRAMARRCLPIKSLRDRQKVASGLYPDGLTYTVPGDPNALDFQLLSMITGIYTSPDDYNLREDQVLHNNEPMVSSQEMETFENTCDLLWWYYKMDVYQTMLGGTKQLMDYEHWTQCPPRAPISRLDRIYGTWDHLLLLLGRLARFVANEYNRKSREGQAKGSQSDAGSSPPFPGLLPTKGTVRPPMGFGSPQSANTGNDRNENLDSQSTYQEALNDWESISHAFDTFASSLGPDFQPLEAEYAELREEVFGSALQYRTHSIAGIWMNYYMGLIYLYRNHPDMPPTALQSVGLAAPNTARYASQIGRIASGLSNDTSHLVEISNTLAAALIECAFPLFVAGVQYQSDHQRKWMVKRMHEITRLTGWQSARQIADGCESSWTIAAQSGRGPPYVRVPDMEADDQSIWNTARRIDRRIQEIYNSGEERRVVVAQSERAHYAWGLLGVEDDLKMLDLKDTTFNRCTEEL